jgi:hypothetical protein
MMLRNVVVLINLVASCWSFKLSNSTFQHQRIRLRRAKLGTTQLAAAFV